MEERISRIRSAVVASFVKKGDEVIAGTGSWSEPEWLFDFRRAILKGETLDDIAEEFWSRMERFLPAQVGGVEVASIPIISALVMKSVERGKPLNGFFIRKSRKKSGLLRMVEGTLTGESVVLVDDLMNTGNSLLRQVDILEGLGKKVAAVIVILRFRGIGYYEKFREKGIEVVSLFELGDFKESLGVSNLPRKDERPVPRPFRALWKFSSPNPNLFYVVPKSAPALDDSRVYFGSDSGVFWALNQNDGSVAWQYRVGLKADGKSIFSSPCIVRDLVMFGSYDGNVYALDRATGKRKWVFMDADWVGSSPAYSEKHDLVYVGLEFGLMKKRGGIAAVRRETGEKVWEASMEGLTHFSPAVSDALGVVVCGSNDGSFRGFDAKSGKELWNYRTGGDVKASAAFDERRGLVVVGSFDKHVYILNARKGTPVHTPTVQEAIYSIPLVCGDYAYVAGLDKRLYAIHLETGVVAWHFPTLGRIFASPILAEGKLYIGSNDGRFYELDPETGKNTAVLQLTERIVNKAAYNPRTKRFFVPTFANEIYCVAKD